MAQLPHIFPTSINQPNQNMPHRSELSQDRSKTTRKDIRVIPRQEAKPPGKTSELSFLGHRWRNCLLSWDNSDRCGILCIFWLGWLMDVGSCAIYVPLVALGSPPCGDTTGRHKRETQRGDKGEKERGEQKEKTK